MIAKNTIRGSNQRCVVIHGTHNATVVENIAYDTFGHCFMTEDGGELCWNALESVCLLTRSLKYDKIIPKTIFVCLLCDFMTFVICLLCFHSFVLFSCFVVSTCSRKNRFHTQHTDLSIVIGKLPIPTPTGGPVLTPSPGELVLLMWDVANIARR